MKKILFSLFSCTICICLIHLNGIACTTFQLNNAGQILVGKNYDWMVDDGLIIVNKRGLKKIAIGSINDVAAIGQPASWTSRYGSVTFNQYGRELPAGGMNEAGLVVESMALRDSQYPEPDSRASIPMGQWIQYQLDNHARVEEVVASDKALRIRQRKGVTVHFLVSDKNGNCAAIEFLSGKQVCHLNETMPYRVLTNSTYAKSAEHRKQNRLPETERYKSIERFVAASKMLDSYQPGISKSSIDYSFDILENVSWSVETHWNEISWITDTKWSIVYDLQNLRIHFRTLNNRQTRSIDLTALDFSCATPVQVLDLNAKISGGVTNAFIDYTQQLNRDLIGSAFEKTPFFPKFDPELLDRLSRYPETTVCIEGN